MPYTPTPDFYHIDYNPYSGPRGFEWLQAEQEKRLKQILGDELYKWLSLDSLEKKNSYESLKGLNNESSAS